MLLPQLIFLMKLQFS